MIRANGQIVCLVFFLSLFVIQLILHNIYDIFLSEQEKFILRTDSLRGGRPTKYLRFQDAIDLIMVLPGKLAKETRSKFADILRRYMAGDASLMGEIDANAQSSSAAAELARASLAESILGKRPVYIPGYRSHEAPSGPDQSSELQGMQLQAFQQMTTNQQQIKVGVDMLKSVQEQNHARVTGDLGLLNGKVGGVGDEIVIFKGEVMKGVTSVHEEVKKGNDDRIKKLEQQLREKEQQLREKEQQLRGKDLLLNAAEATRIKENKNNKTLLDTQQEANKRQRFTISELNKQRNEQITTSETVKKIGTNIVKTFNKIDAVEKDTKKLITVLWNENTARENETADLKAMLAAEIAARQADAAAHKAETAEIKELLKTLLGAISP